MCRSQANTTLSTVATSLGYSSHLLIENHNEKYGSSYVYLFIISSI